MSPPFSQRLEAGQGGSGIIPIVDDRPGVRAEDRRVIVYSMDPQIKQNVHFRAFACLDQFMGFSNWKKEKAGILFTGDGKSTRLNSSHVSIAYAVCCFT